MKIGRLVQAAWITGSAFFMMTASASANVIYSTNGASTMFLSGGVITNSGLTLNSSGGAAATLTYQPNINSNTGVPSNVNYGDFLLTCPSCTTQNLGGGAVFGLFAFDLEIIDQTDGATGIFHGTSSGQTVFSDVSTITISWTPLQLGPGGSNALSGSFGPTVFQITSPTGIVAPNSGTPPGDTTVQGHVDSQASGVPEPATFGLIGGALLGLGLLSRKRFFRQ